MKLSHARGVTQDEQVIMERSDRMWSTGEGRIVITVHFTKGTLRNVSVVKDLGKMSEVLSLRTQGLDG